MQKYNIESQHPYVLFISMGMTRYGRDLISHIICYVIPLTRITNIEGYQNHTHTQL